MRLLTLILLAVGALALQSATAYGAQAVTKTPLNAKAKLAPKRATTSRAESYSLLADYKKGTASTHRGNNVSRKLASGDNGADLNHYYSMERRLGVDLGMMIPLQDFANVASLSPMIGIHFEWAAIPPWALTLNYRRSSSDNKTTPGSTKLSVNQISIGAQASFPSGNFVPFIKLEGALYFNDYQVDSAPIAQEGIILTTVGASAGIGFDFIVGREVSIGFDAMFHYAVPKNITVSGTNFNLGSMFSTVGFRLNF